MGEFVRTPRRGAGIRRSSLVACVVLAAALLVTPAQAAPGELDPSFGTGGKVLTDIAPNGIAQALALQPDGKIIAVGSASGSGESIFALARYNPDGSPDTTFGSGGVVTTDFSFSGVFGGGATAVALQPDGKIIAVGSSAFQNFALARYNPDGSLDSTFGSGGKVTTDFGFADASALAVTVDPDGKIRVAGVRRPFDLTSIDFALARFNADGSLDSTFGAGGKVVSPFGPLNGTSIFAERFEPDGKILAAGIAFANFAPFGSNGDFALARYNADGSVDTGFGTGGRLTTDFNGSDDEARGVAIQPDGKIVAAGSSGAIPQFALARYNPDGSLDSSFGVGGKVTTNVSPIAGNGARAVAIESGGDVLAAGSAFTGVAFGGSDDFALVRYTAAGALDSSFGTGGTVITDFAGGNDRANALALQPDGRIVAAGFAFDGPVVDFALARYLGTPTALEVTIDIKPGGFPNPINPGSKGTIPVAILSTSGFDAPSQVDTTSLRFGRTGNESSLAFCSSPQDVNGDGLLDLVCHFSIQKTGFQTGDTQGVLTGKTVTGTPIMGTDSVVIVPPT